MPKSTRAAQTLQRAMLVLSVFALTACNPFKPKPQPVILQESKAIRIQQGDLPNSPNFKGWGLSDQATAKLLEAAESCKGK